MMGKKALEQTDPNTVYRGLNLDDETLIPTLCIEDLISMMRL
jgi:hypothetical protein